MGRELDRRVEQRIHRMAELALQGEGRLEARAERVARMTSEMLGVEVEYLAGPGEAPAALHGTGAVAHVRPDRDAEPPSSTRRRVLTPGQPLISAARPGYEVAFGIRHGVGASSYVEAAVTANDGEIFGRFRCLHSGTDQPAAVVRDVRLVKMLARLVARQLEGRRGRPRDRLGQAPGGHYRGWDRDGTTSD